VRWRWRQCINIPAIGRFAAGHACLPMPQVLLAPFIDMHAIDGMITGDSGPEVWPVAGFIEFALYKHNSAGGMTSL
jgi:hypothetical protein